MTAPDAKMTTYTYDTNNRLTQILADVGQSFSFAYDSLNRRTKLIYPNGITANYTYDALGRLTSLLHKTSNNSTIDSFTYTYDNIGNKLTAIDTAGSHQYQYDPIYRLTGVNHPTTPDEAYAYDPVGNRLTDIQARTYTYNNANELLTQNGTSFTYDNNGSITTKTDTTGTTSYVYDYENRLIKATMPSGTIAEYKYDPFGRRIEKKTTTGNKTKTTKYLYDREDILYELDASNNIITKYIHGPGIDEPLAMIRGSNSYYYHADGLGSITSITSSRARISQQYRYDSFGNITYMKDTRFTQPYTYTGREYDQETGLYYLRNRYYDGKVGRFVSRDPIGFAGGTNLYRYAKNNPIRYKDPFGLIWVTIGYDYQAKSDWLRWWLNRWTRVIGEGMNPTVPGSAPEEYAGLTRDVIQEWRHDPNNSCRDNEYLIGSQRRIRQTYTQYMNPGSSKALTNNPDDPYFYQWTPLVNSPTYDGQSWRQEP